MIEVQVVDSREWREGKGITKEYSRGTTDVMTAGRKMRQSRSDMFSGGARLGDLRDTTAVAECSECGKLRAHWQNISRTE